MRESSTPDEGQGARRRGVRRTVLVFVVVAVAIYVGFILTTGVLTR
jgi:hypothetical protein